MITVRATLHEQEIREAVRVPGDGELVVDGVAALDAVEDRCVTFVNRDVTDEVRAALARGTGCVVIAPPGSRLDDELDGSRVLEVADPRAAIARVLGLISELGRQPPWVDARDVAPGASISPHAVVEGDVRIGDGARIEAFCTVASDVSIGAGTVLSAGARVYSHVSIGEHTTIGANTVVGHPGNGFVRDDDGHKTRIPHLAGVVIGSHVDIGALGVVQSGSIVPTEIEDHVKIDDQVGVGHGAHVGADASITAGVILGGTVVIGTEAWIGINATIRNGRRVGDYALVGMDASVQDDLPDDTIARAPAAAVAPRADDDRTGIGFLRLPRPSG